MKGQNYKAWSIGSFIRGQKKSAKLTSTSVALIENIDVRDSKRAHEKDINSLAMSPNDALLASGSQDKTIPCGTPKIYTSSHITWVNEEYGA